jgi:hypothetical protein
MKTTNQSKRSFPKPARFSIYVCAVVVFCFFNWIALRAEDPKKSLENPLAAALVEEVEAEIELQDWMLTFSEDFLTADETEIKLEPWMLTFSNDYIADKEPEIKIEPWMLSFSDDFMETDESDLSLEYWMTSTFLWGTAYLLVRK